MQNGRPKGIDRSDILKLQNRQQSATEVASFSA
jgi:hypothetical protein